MLTNENSKSCYSKITTCYFNTSAKQKVYVIGDSHVGSLTYELKDKLVDKNYQFITVNCMYFPGFTNFKKKPKISEKCNNNFLQDLKRHYQKRKIQFLFMVEDFLRILMICFLIIKRVV